VSCQSTKNSNKASVNDLQYKPDIVVYDYQIWLSDPDKKELRDSTVVHVDTSSANGKINYYFKDLKTQNSLFWYSLSLNRDSIFYEGVFCWAIDTFYLEYHKKSIEIFKCFYDIENSYDEESYIYWNPDYGLISVYNFPWGALLLFDNKEIKGFAKIGFYDYIINQEREAKEKLKITN